MVYFENWDMKSRKSLQVTQECTFNTSEQCTEYIYVWIDFMMAYVKEIIWERKMKISV